MDLRQSIKSRRSYYDIEKKSLISDDEIMELVELATRHIPSAFNGQSQTTAVLLGEKHDQLWDIAMESLRKVVPPDKFGATEAKINGFKAGYGTILFFDDEGITKSLQESFAFYADNFPTWAEQANGMLQFAIWSLLEAEGFGVSLQHYNPLIDEAVHTAFEIPGSWRLIAQMPFGVPASQPEEKEFAEITTRMKRIK